MDASLTPEVRRKPILKQEIAFLIIHLLPLAALWTGATLFDWLTCIFLYVFRMFWVTGGYHRYFAHKAYKTSRWFQFVIAFMAETSAQKGALWWAAHHRHHHRYSDTPKDPHSMKIYGFWYSHIGWIVGPDFKETEFKTIGDYAKYPELVLDGPLQYDAASVVDVGKQKAPNSPVAGQATVFVFPDLNTGNTTYKAVQRSANVVSIGPMLQGLRKPVNDLSRGALVDDIVFTIALTAIQAQGIEDIA